ncbi:tetratricopeptide repeat protein [Lutibacter citreus]|uniref:tetratricopeptide repeat protein n=1 Tax=Lutibacter citreus TaxID=2138210 RepID=UPI000DBE145B|nr:hypothetical protein [Lutibacter citreus]
MKNILYILSFVLASTAIAQNSNNLELQKQKLKLALSYNDKEVASSAMYNIIAIEGDNSSYKDSLAYLYFNGAKYVSCFLVVNDVLKNKPDNIELLEMGAVSLESMGAYSKAIESYTSLIAKTNNNYHAYKLAGLYILTNKFEEALTTIKKANSLEDTGTIKVNFKVNQNYNQDVDLKAAIAYLEGVIYLKLNKEGDAKLSFMRAINLYPDFVLAKSKLSTLENSQSKIEEK